MDLIKQVEADLARSGLTPEDAERMGVKAYTRAEAAKLKLSHAAAGYLLPYFDLKGRQTKFFRYRLLEDVRTGFDKVKGGRAPKYLQPPRTASEVYLPVLLDWEAVASDHEIPLVITEGEKKAYAGCKAGFAVAGLGGVWSFQSAKRNQPLLPTLEKFEWKERVVQVVFDSDAALNPHVRLAASRLAGQLSARGAIVYVGYLPTESHEQKIGLDDYLLDHEPEELEKWLAGLEPYSESAALHAMNERVTYVFDPGLVVVNSTGQQITPNAFVQHAFAHYTHTESYTKKDGTPGMKTLSTPRAWLQWPQRAEVGKLVYAPGQPEIHEGGLNLWTGLAVEPTKGDIGPWKKLLDFLFAGEPGARRWFEQWLAYPLQHPGVKMPLAALVWGRTRGTGKSLIGVTMSDIYGSNASTVGDRDFATSFNSWAHRKQFIFYDEVTPNDNRERANLLKTLVTQESVTVNIKHLPQFTLRDCMHYYLTSNDPDALYIEPGERRFFVHEVKASEPLPTQFYDEYVKWRKDGGPAHLLHHFLDLSLEGFNPHGRAPRTEALQAMIGATRTELEVFLTDLIESPDEMLARYGNGDLLSLVEITAEYDRIADRRTATTLVARKLKQLGLSSVGTRMRVGGHRTVLYALRNYAKWEKASEAQLRKHFEQGRKKR